MLLSGGRGSKRVVGNRGDPGVKKLHESESLIYVAVEMRGENKREEEDS